MSKCPVSRAIKVLTSVLCLLSVFTAPTTTSPTSLDKILAAMTIAAERNNKERFASIVEGLENHEAQQLQVWTHTAETSRRPSCPNAHHACSPPYPRPPLERLLPVEHPPETLKNLDTPPLKCFVVCVYINSTKRHTAVH